MNLQIGGGIAPFFRSLELGYAQSSTLRFTWQCCHSIHVDTSIASMWIRFVSTD
jgi:hypothetical protein